MHAYLRVRDIVPKRPLEYTSVFEGMGLTWTVDFPDRVRRDHLCIWSIRNPYYLYQ